MTAAALTPEHLWRLADALAEASTLVDRMPYQANEQLDALLDLPVYPSEFGTLAKSLSAMGDSMQAEIDGAPE